MKTTYFDAECSGKPVVQVVRPNGGESLYQGALDTINWSSMGLRGTLTLELLVNNAVAGTIAQDLPAWQTSYQWQVGKTLTGWVNPGATTRLGWIYYFCSYFSPAHQGVI